MITKGSEPQTLDGMRPMTDGSRWTAPAATVAAAGPEAGSEQEVGGTEPGAASGAAPETAGFGDYELGGVPGGGLPPGDGNPGGRSPARAKLARRRLLGWAGAAVVAALVATQVPHLLPAAHAQVSQYATATAGLGAVAETVQATGTVQAQTTENVTFAVGGTITTVPVKVGTTVKTGQVLATLDSSTLKAQLASAQGSLAQAQANLQSVETGASPAQIQVDQATVAQAQTNLETKTQVDAQAVAQAKQNLAAQQQVYAAAQQTYSLQAPVTDSMATLAQEKQTLAQAQESLQSAQQAVTTAETQQAADQKNLQQSLSVAQAQLAALKAPAQPSAVAQAQAQVQQAQAQVTLIQSQVAEMTVTSPVNGVVTAVNVNPGETASVGESAFAVQASGALQAVVPVDEIDIARIKVGQPTVTVADALPGQQLAGKVLQIAPAGVASNGVSTYDVWVSLPDNTQLQAGMSAAVTFDVAQQSNVLRVPAEAVKGSGSKGTVQVLVNGKPQTRQVGIGVSSAQWTQITSGLQAGDVVVVAQVSASGSPGGPGGRPGGGRGPGGGAIGALAGGRG